MILEGGKPSSPRTKLANASNHNCCSYSIAAMLPSDVSEESMSLLEASFLLMYDRTSDTLEVNDARKQLRTQV
ncbi:hypothetical protein GWK47_043026 [Chionoecetes opilio]|uniref:Uncharacterized protein n=1 Tax=Chionoecetes opilio TaxID=41210 RepID=A0A8J5CZU1_CHIOP|nr:hypothetical protein GWK47_043026 [Chionoecetes opilio]